MSDNSRNWSAGQLQYMAWCALPKSERKPDTEAEIAAKIGVDDRTLRRWKQLPGFWDSVRDEARANLRASIGRIYGALIKEAESGNFQHIKLALEMLGEHIDRLEVGSPLEKEVLQLLKNGDVTTEQVLKTLGDNDRTRRLIEGVK